jgi:predicted  nucleic acid-binding Zn-ribbon protein
MHPSIPHLIELQRVDHRTALLRADLESFPKRLREADAQQSGARAEIASAKEALAKINAERKKFEFEGQEWKDRVRKYRDQSGAVKTNEAYRALQHEIANAEAEIAKAEDRQLEVMMRAEEAERRLKLAESRLKEAEESLAAEKRKIEAQASEIKKQLEAAAAEREKIVAPVPEDLRDLYARIAKRHGGTALAQVRDDQCRGCGLRVLPHIVQELRSETSEEVYRCESCGLILYSLEPVPYAKPAGGSANAASPPSTN